MFVSINNVKSTVLKPTNKISLYKGKEVYVRTLIISSDEGITEIELRSYQDSSNLNLEIEVAPNEL